MVRENSLPVNDILETFREDIKWNDQEKGEKYRKQLAEDCRRKKKHKTC